MARVPEREVRAREISGGRLRVRAARLPAVKLLNDFGRPSGFDRGVSALLVHSGFTLPPSDAQPAPLTGDR